MQRKAIKRIAALFVAAVMVVGLLGAMTAMAATTYTPVSGTSTTFTKYLIMDAGDTVPNATFSFTVAPGTARSADTADNAVMEVKAGVGTPTIADVTFSPSDTTTTTITGLIDVTRTNVQRGGATGDAAVDVVQLDAGEKFASKTATVDFSSVSFNEPGIYRYIISETASATHAAAGITHDTDTDRVLDVYVIDAGSGLQVAAYVLHTTDDDVAIGANMGSADVATAGAALTDKTDGFTNEISSKDLVFKCDVSGNQASRDKYFKYTITMTNVNDDDTFVVSLADDSDNNTTDGNADATSGTTAATKSDNQGQTNATSVTGAELKAGKAFFLQGGQSIAIRGLAPNATYALSVDAEDYKPTNAGVTGYDDAVSGTVGTVAAENKAVMTSILLTRDGVIPTGILAAGLSGLAVVIAGGATFAGIRISKKRRNAEEENSDNE